MPSVKFGGSDTPEIEDSVREAYEAKYGSGRGVRAAYRTGRFVGHVAGFAVWALAAAAVLVATVAVAHQAWRLAEIVWRAT